MSVFTNADPHVQAYWADCNRATGQALLQIAEVDGPAAASATALSPCRAPSRPLKSPWVSSWRTQARSSVNIMRRTRSARRTHARSIQRRHKPWAETRVEIRVPEREYPQNKEGKDCDCMNREYLLKYKKGVLHWCKQPAMPSQQGSASARRRSRRRFLKSRAPSAGVLESCCVAEEAEFKCSQVLGYLLCHD